MTFQEFLTDIKVEMRQYYESGLIDDQSVYKWYIAALKKFGATIMIYQEKVIEINNNKGILPNNFFSLKGALKCSPDKVICSEEDEPILVRSLFWHDIQMKQKGWDLCTGECCNNEVEETVIRDNQYIDGRVFTKTYKDPVDLKLSPSFKKSLCDSGCANKYNSSSPYEINIVGNQLYTNFKEGDVYIKYKGLEEDDEGFIILPDTPKGEVLTYVSVYVKRNILEGILLNGEDNGVSTLFKYYLEMERPQLGLALTEAKFLSLTPQSMYKLQERNIKNRQRFEYRK